MKPPDVIWLRWENKTAAVFWMQRRKKTLASGGLLWFEEVIGNMGELHEEEVADVRMPMTWQKVIGKKIRARESDRKED